MIRLPRIVKNIWCLEIVCYKRVTWFADRLLWPISPNLCRWNPSKFADCGLIHSVLTYGSSVHQAGLGYTIGYTFTHTVNPLNSTKTITKRINAITQCHLLRLNRVQFHLNQFNQVEHLRSFKTRLNRFAIHIHGADAIYWISEISNLVQS